MCKIKANRTRRARIKSIDANKRDDMISKTFFLSFISDGVFSWEIPKSISCIFLRNTSKKRKYNVLFWAYVHLFSIWTYCTWSKLFQHYYFNLPGKKIYPFNFSKITYLKKNTINIFLSSFPKKYFKRKLNILSPKKRYYFLFTSWSYLLKNFVSNYWWGFLKTLISIF